jgi:integrase
MSRSSAARARPAGAAPSSDGDLRFLIDWEALSRVGFDPAVELFAPDAGDPVFGFAVCRAASCDQVVHSGSLGLCWRCGQLWQKAGPGADFEQFCATVPGRARHSRGGALCRVCRTPGHERPVRSHGLCAMCSKTMASRGQSAGEYVSGDEEYPAAVPRPSFGRCLVAACDRWAWRARPALCEAHDETWLAAGRPGGRSLEAWCLRQRCLDGGPRVVALRGLGGQVQLEVLYALQRAAETGRRTRPAVVQGAVNILRAQGVASISELPAGRVRRGAPRLFLTFAADQVTLALATRESEAAKDNWDLRVFGHRPGLLRFSPIAQDWLKQTAKRWAAERAGTVETPKVLQTVLRAVRAFSESLCRHRPDRGADQHLLSRADLMAFASDLAHLEARGDLARNTRRAWMLEVGRFLREARSMGLSRPGGPMCGLPEDVAFRPSDRVRSASRDERGRALPQVVLDQLLDTGALDGLEASYGTQMRAMVEIGAAVGRRTGELCGLRLQCLAYEEIPDETGRLRAAPTLIHDMPKVGVRGYRLPIDEQTAGIIREQQARVRARYPGTPVSQLALFPAVVMNPQGVKGCNVTTVDVHFRDWVDGLAELLGPDGEPYDRSDVTIYSFRHSFAQRHADAGTPIEVLAELMGHTRLTSTQAYFKVTDKRKRKAVDLLAGLQVDHDGKRSRPLVQRLLETEATRQAIGQVAVPFGICTEPANVKAHGQACPFRHQCFGCTYFRSDPSFLPELRAYLTRLLADNERLRAALPELEDWARQAALPSAEEIAALRRIIGRCEELLASLAADQRAEIEEAVVTLRRVRAQLDTSIPAPFRGVIAQPSAGLFPIVERDRQERRARDDHD